MRILVTNDDGIDAPGIDALQKIAKELSDDVWIVAPESNNSGASHSVTLNEPLRLTELGEKKFMVKGTPADCVILGVMHLLSGHPPDLVLSGVNVGQNVADDITYSGTVAGAMEGAFLGIPSIALSLTGDFNGKVSFKWQTPTALGPDLLRSLLAAGWPDNVVINVNFPDLEPSDVKGMLITTQGHRSPDLVKIDERIDPNGMPYYWIGYRRRQSKPAEGSDLLAINSGYISVTPLDLDLTHRQTCENMSAAFTHDAVKVSA